MATLQRTKEVLQLPVQAKGETMNPISGLLQDVGNILHDVESILEDVSKFSNMLDNAGGANGSNGGGENIIGDVVKILPLIAML